MTDEDLRGLIEKEIRRFYVDRPYEDGLQEATDRIIKIVKDSLASVSSRTSSEEVGHSFASRKTLAEERLKGRAEAIEYARRRINYHMGGSPKDWTDTQVILIHELLAFKGFSGSSPDSLFSTKKVGEKGGEKK
jgi:hypothetical protein